MRSRFLLLVGGVALSAAAPTANAHQTAAPLHLATGIPTVHPAPDSARIEGVLSRADNATAAGRMNEARRLYRALIQEQHDANRYAGTAIWRLAANHIYDGDIMGGAQLLDDLADEASRFGDAAIELRATFEAAVLWQKVKRPDLTARDLERVRCLLQSPVLSADVKSAIERRIVE